METTTRPPAAVRSLRDSALHGQLQGCWSLGSFVAIVEEGGYTKCRRRDGHIGVVVTVGLCLQPSRTAWTHMQNALPLKSDGPRGQCQFWMMVCMVEWQCHPGLGLYFFVGPGDGISPAALAHVGQRNCTHVLCSSLPQ